MCRRTNQKPNIKTLETRSLVSGVVMLRYCLHIRVVSDPWQLTSYKSIGLPELASSVTRPEIMSSFPGAARRHVLRPVKGGGRGCASIGLLEMLRVRASAYAVACVDIRRYALLCHSLPRARRWRRCPPSLCVPRRAYGCGLRMYVVGLVETSTVSFTCVGS